VAPETPKGGGTYTINAPKYQGSPVHLPGGGFIKKGWCAMYPTANRLLAGGNGSGKEVRETCAESGGPGPNLLPIGK
jgi:hypothetical protein